MGSRFLLEIRDLSISFLNKKALIYNSDFLIAPGRVVGLFGDSGSGKSVFSFFLLGFLKKNTFLIRAKKALFKTVGFSFSLLKNNNYCWDNFRSRFVSMIFQDPSTSLNPTLTCGKQIEEVFLHLGRVSGVKKLCFSLLKEVELLDPEKVYFSYPHELSGGQNSELLLLLLLLQTQSF